MDELSTEAAGDTPILEPAPAPVSLRAAARLDPFEQGYFDGFCGLYAILNGLTLLGDELARPLSLGQCETLFRHGVSFLDGRRKLSAAARYGIRARLWPVLAIELVATASRMLGVRLDVYRPFKRAKAIDRPTLLLFIRQALRDRRPVLLLLKGRLDHYTVVVGVSAKRLRLFDSYGYHWIEIAGISADVASDARHRVHAPSLMILFAG